MWAGRSAWTGRLVWEGGEAIEEACEHGLLPVFIDGVGREEALDVGYGVLLAPAPVLPTWLTSVAAAARRPRPGALILRLKERWEDLRPKETCRAAGFRAVLPQLIRGLVGRVG